MVVGGRGAGIEKSKGIRRRHNSTVSISYIARHPALGAVSSRHKIKAWCFDTRQSEFQKFGQWVPKHSTDVCGGPIVFGVTSHSGNNL